MRFIKSARFQSRGGRRPAEAGDGTRCGEARQLAEHKLADVRQKLTDLQRIESVLSALVARCSAVRGRVNCPLIASLQETA